MSCIPTKKNKISLILVGKENKVNNDSHKFILLMIKPWPKNKKQEII